MVYPAITAKVREKKGKSAETFAKHRHVVPDTAILRGASVMVLDKTRESKWDLRYDVPFTVVRSNRRGAFILKDRLGDILKRAVRADQQKWITRSGIDPVVEAENSLLIKKILNHRNKAQKVEYLVEWADMSIESTWEPIQNFDDINITKQYWKETRLTRKKTSTKPSK